MVQVTPVCGAKKCEALVRAQLTHMSEAAKKEREESEGRMYGKMSCQVCEKEDAKRCAGCGQAAYCGGECQRKNWGEHKRLCRRRRLPKPNKGEGGVELPFDSI